MNLGYLWAIIVVFFCNIVLLFNLVIRKSQITMFNSTYILNTCNTNKYERMYRC